jgi:hydrogenase-4 component B
MTTAVLLSGVGVLVAGTLLALWQATVRYALATQMLGATALAAAGVAVLASGETLGAAFTNEFQPSLGLDGLSAFFVVVVCATAVPALLVAADALRGSQSARPLTALSGAFVLALVGVLAARDVTMFLGFWELMTLVPAAAILVDRRDEAVRRAVFVYLAITHLGGAGVWVAMLILAHEGALGGSLDAPGLQAVVAIAAIIGFGTKAGLMPLHSWLPRAHPVAPAHISALMSGVMIKVALYGLIRVLFEWAGPVPLWVGIVLLALGLLSSLGGVLYALVQHELKQLLAFHSIENVGIIALGLGAALILDTAHEREWASLAFAAALLHTVNHAVFKALLFLGAGAFAQAVGGLQLDRLGGLLRRMPWTGWTFLVGCAAIAGLPPLNGFASEWLTLQALLHVGFDSRAGISVAGALATAGLAATAALAVFCFVKVVGLVLLGAPRTPAAAEALERPALTRAGLAILAFACVLLGLLPGLVLPTLAALKPGPTDLEAGLRIELPGTGGLPPVGLAVVLIAVAALLLRATSTARRATPTPAWTCGQRVEPALAWTSAGFTKPLRLILEAVYRPRREFEVRTQGALVKEVSYHAEVPHLFDTMLYDPAHRAALRAAAVVRRLQSGSLRLYLVYLVALLVVLLALVRLGVLS